MASENSRQTTLLAIQAAKGHGMMTSVDVNLRPNFWKSGAQMAQEVRHLVDLSDIVKLTLDEARLLALDMTALTKGGQDRHRDGRRKRRLHPRGRRIREPPRHGRGHAGRYRRRRCVYVGVFVLLHHTLRHNAAAGAPR